MELQRAYVTPAKALLGIFEFSNSNAERPLHIIEKREAT